MRRATIGGLLALVLGERAAHAATLTVNTTADTVVGACGASSMSLRKAIGCAAPGDIIAFSTVTFPTATVTAIAVSGTQLPNLNDASVTLDGGGRVRLDGSALIGSKSGLYVVANSVQVTGLEIASFPGSGVVVDGTAGVIIGGGLGNVIRDNGGAGVRILATGAAPAVGTLVSGNRIGTDASGASPDGNCTGAATGCAGVLVGLNADDTEITGNVISATASGPGVLVRQSDTVVSDNLIGTNAAGTAALPNHGDGILVTGGPGVLVEGVEITGNQVSGNQHSGIALGAACAGVIVQDNLVGTDPLGNSAIPNGWDGIRVSGSDGHFLGGLVSGEGNVVSGNEGSGIAIGGATGGDWASDVFVGDNRIGTNATGTAALANERYGIVTSGRGGGHQIGGTAWTSGGNLVSGNDLGGVWVGDPGVTLTVNRIGTDASGLAALPNGLDPAGSPDQVFGGILVDSRGATIGAGATTGNLISGNAGDGIWLHGEGLPMAIGLGDHGIYGNTIGTDLPGAGILGNTGDGVRVEVGGVEIGAPGTGNLVAGNDGVGVHLLGNDVTPVVGVFVEDNEIGRVPSVGLRLENSLGGIQVEQDELQMPVAANRFLDNLVAGNGEHGILFSGPTDGNTASGNLLHSNDLCAIAFEDGAQEDLKAPTIKSATASLVTVEVPEDLDEDVDRVEVYSDSDTEAGTYLGDATFLSGRLWTLAGPGTFPAHARIRALMVMADGTSSALTDTCGDGCAVPDNRQCDDGNECTTEWCDEDPSVLACVSGDPRPAGWRCEDGDECTGVVTALTYDPDVCDGNGTCLAGEVIDVVDAANDIFTLVDPTECPWSSDCNVPSCTPDKGCHYEHLCDEVPSLGVPESVCSPDDLDIGDPEDVCDPCPECALLADGDEDGLKDDWETNGVDVDCDPLTPAVPIPDADPGIRQIFLEIDYMSADCTEGSPELHNHRPLQADVDALEDLFLVEAGIDLVVEVDDCIPEAQLVSMGAFPGDPDCDLGDFVLFRDVKQQHFDVARRGIYHYSLIGHSYVREAHGYTFDESDGDCLGVGRSTGLFLNDDTLIAVGTKEWTAGSAAGLFRKNAMSALLHELGHNFMLGHGGSQTSNTFNSKPNYQSEMNYRYSYGLELDGDSGDTGDAKESNFSRELLGYDLTPGDTGDPEMYGLDEVHLDEAAGLQGIPYQYVVEWECLEIDDEFHGSVGSAASPVALDWDCDGDPTEADVLADVSGKGGEQDNLLGYDDWSSLRLDFQCGGGNSLDGSDIVETAEAGLSREEAERLGHTQPLLQVAVDVAPSCAANPVLVGGGSSLVKVVVAGGAGWSVADLVPRTVRFQGARPRRLERADVDADSDLDAVLWFDSADVYLSPTAIQGQLSGRLESGRRLYGYGSVTPVTSLPDADADGVTDACDACPSTTPGLPVGDAGCP